MQVATFRPLARLIRGFCSFSLAARFRQAPRSSSATLKVTETSSSGAIALLGPTVVDHLDYGTLDDDDFDLAPLHGEHRHLPGGGRRGRSGPSTSRRLSSPTRWPRAPTRSSGFA